MFAPYTLAEGLYVKGAAAVPTISTPNALVVNASMDEELAYQITKAIFEHVADLQAIHPATGEMKIDHAVVGLPVPLHPGAARYYEEVGLQVPERLVAAP